MQKQYYYLMNVISVLQILAAYISEGSDTSQTESLYLIPINPVNGILSSAGSSAAGFGPEQAVDYTLPNSRRTYWNPQGLPRSSSNYFILFDFTTMHLVTKLHIINFGDNVHDVTAFKLESSSNSLNWTEVARFFCQPGTHSKQKFGGFVGIDRYWKFTITNTISGQQPWLVEVGFYGSRSFETASKDRINIGNSTVVQAIRKSIKNALQRSMNKYTSSQSPDVLTNFKDRSRSLKEPAFKYKHNISRTNFTGVPLDDVVDVIGEDSNDNINMMNSKDRSTSLKEPTFKYKHNISIATTTEVPLDDVIDEGINDTINVMASEEGIRYLEEQSFKYKHNISRKPSTEVPLDDVIDEVIDDIMDDNTKIMDPKERSRSLEELKFKYKHNISRQTTTEFTLDVIDNGNGESIDDVIDVNSTEMVPMIGTTKLISHMHVSSLNSNTESFEDFFQMIGISKKKDIESRKISSNVIQVDKGISTKYMTWLYLTMGLVILGITLVAMGCVILQLIKKQNKLLASAIEFNKKPITYITSIRSKRPNNQGKVQNQCRVHKDMQRDIHKDMALPVTPV